MVGADKLNHFLFTCEKCIILQSQLEYERQEKEYFRTLLLKRTGDIVDHIEPLPEDLSQEDPTPVKRGRTLSSIRRQAEVRLKAKQDFLRATPATPHDLSEAERLFETSLTGVKN